MISKQEANACEFHEMDEAEIEAQLEQANADQERESKPCDATRLKNVIDSISTIEKIKKK